MKGHDEIAGHVRDLPFPGRTALVTGGAGFLGSWLCGVLLSCGAEVICLDNFSSGRRSNIAEFSSRPGFACIEQDVSAPLRIERDSLDYIFHLASRASPPEFYAYPIDILRSNTIGTLNTLEVARKYGARYLFTSTSEIYGNAAVFPTPETYHGNVNALGVRGCYDEAKRAGEAYCMAYFRQYGVDITIARIFNTYGPMMRADGIYGRVIPRFIHQALHGEPVTVFGDGSQTRRLCYVSDQVEALQVMRLPRGGGTGGQFRQPGRDHDPEPCRTDPGTDRFPFGHHV